jgi:hypothetical protein
MPNIILKNPTLHQVQEAATECDSDHTIYYRGTLIDITTDDMDVFNFPGSLRVHSIDNTEDCFNLLILDELATWPVALPHEESYQFEIVGSGEQPSVSMYEIPADDLWPNWAAQFRLDIRKEKLKKEEEPSVPEPWFSRLFEAEIIGVTGSEPQNETEIRKLLHENGAFIGDKGIWGHEHIIVIGRTDFDKKYLKRSIEIGMAAGFVCRYMAQEDFLRYVDTHTAPGYTRHDIRT